MKERRIYLTISVKNFMSIQRDLYIPIQTRTILLSVLQTLTNIYSFKVKDKIIISHLILESLWLVLYSNEEI